MDLYLNSPYTALWCVQRQCHLYLYQVRSVQTVLASTHTGRGVTSICMAGASTGNILLTSMKITIGRMDLQLNVGSKTMVNWRLYHLHSHNVTFSTDVCFNLGTNKSTHTHLRGHHSPVTDNRVSYLLTQSPVSYPVMTHVLSCDSPVSYPMTDSPVSYLLTDSQVLSCDNPV